MSDTPIFDRLAAERGYERMTAKPSEREVYERMHPHLPGVTAAEALRNAEQGAESIRKAMGFEITPIEPVMSENFHPKDLEEAGRTEYDVTRETVEKFKEKYPWITGPLDVAHSQELDGTATITVRKGKQTDKTVNAAKPQALKPWITFPEENYETTNLFENIVADAVDKFHRAHPNALITSMTSVPDSDGGLKVKFEGVEPSRLEKERLSFFEGVVAARHMVDMTKDGDVEYIDEVKVPGNVDTTYLMPHAVPSYDEVVAAYEAAMKSGPTPWVGCEKVEVEFAQDRAVRIVEFGQQLDSEAQRLVERKRKPPTWGSDEE